MKLASLMNPADDKSDMPSDPVEEVLESFAPNTIIKGIEEF
jgi:hypothetical protein